MQVGEDGHTAGAQLVLAINSKLPLNLFNTHPGLGSVWPHEMHHNGCEPESFWKPRGEWRFWGADGGFKASVGGVLLNLGAGGQGWGVGNVPDGGATVRSSAQRDSW